MDNQHPATHWLRWLDPLDCGPYSLRPVEKPEAGCQKVDVIATHGKDKGLHSENLRGRIDVNYKAFAGLDATRALPLLQSYIQRAYFGIVIGCNRHLGFLALIDHCLDDVGMDNDYLDFTPLNLLDEAGWGLCGVSPM